MAKIRNQIKMRETEHPTYEGITMLTLCTDPDLEWRGSEPVFQMSKDPTDWRYSDVRALVTDPTVLTDDAWSWLLCRYETNFWIDPTGGMTWCDFAGHTRTCLAFNAPRIIAESGHRNQWLQFDYNVVILEEPTTKIRPKGAPGFWPYYNVKRAEEFDNPTLGEIWDKQRNRFGYKGPDHKFAGVFDVQDFVIKCGWIHVSDALAFSPEFAGTDMDMKRYPCTRKQGRTMELCRDHAIRLDGRADDFKPVLGSMRLHGQVESRIHATT